MKNVFKLDISGRTLRVEIGEVAKQSNGAALLRYGETTVLAAAVGKKEAGEGDFFPLTINYNEKMYAAGKMPGGFIKREAKPSEHATLTARLIDRPIRPLFPEGYRNEVQITNTVLSIEPDCSPEMTALLASSIALCISDIPFCGPVAAVKVGRVDGKLIINPTPQQEELSDMDLTVAGTKENINMVESGAKEVSEDEILDGLMFAHEEIKRICAFEEKIIAQIGKAKMSYDVLPQNEELQAEIYDKGYQALREAITTFDKLQRDANIEQAKADLVAFYEEKFAQAEDYDEKMAEVVQLIDDLEKQTVRTLITKEDIRPDGRKIDEIRPLDAQIDFLPRVHGSGLFTRGQTQVLSVLTLATLGEGQTIDGLGKEETKHFMHQYNFPQFSVGETGRSGAPGRREIGHGALGERALKAVIPSEEQFPYTIRLVAEVLESNGSSSQASICAGTLALMAGGVPIKAPVAGIAMGLVKEGQDYTILTDIQGIEDHLGDMDFKVAGTRKGITALQMDIKVDGVTREILAQALAQAKKARFQILDVIENTIAQPRAQLSEYAPKIESLQIKKDQIKIVIGKGGDTINKIIDGTGVKIDIDEEGLVQIASNDQAMITRAKEIIEELTREAKVGDIYQAKVTRIEKFGAFVELFKGTEALVHISQLAAKRVEKVEDVVKLGDVLEVKVTEIDSQGRINASHKILLPKEDDTEESKQEKRTQNGKAAGYKKRSNSKFTIEQKSK